jgi:hypothetical protein
MPTARVGRDARDDFFLPFGFPSSGILFVATEDVLTVDRPRY